MMKKVSLVVVALLVTASLANAAYTLAPSAVSIAPNASLTTSFTTDAAITSGKAYALVADTAGLLITGGSYVGPKFPYTDEDGNPQINIDGFVSDLTASAAGTPGLVGEDGIFAIIALFGTDQVPANTKLFDGINIKGLQAGTYTVSLYTVPSNFASKTLEGSFNVLVTPEPATMALLGLGGLLLRKKK